METYKKLFWKAILVDEITMQFYGELEEIYCTMRLASDTPMMQLSLKKGLKP